MNWGEKSHPGGESGGGDRLPGRRVVQLQGPRPSPLSINKESRKIGKPPLPPNQPQRAPPPRNREPVIIYDISPKVIHTEPTEFMSVVQRLTGLCSSSAAPSDTSSGGPVSPAARMAAVERASPTGRRRERAAESELMGLMETGEFDLGQIPGILTPAPANLPEVTAGMFCPVVESETQFGFQDNLMSPSVYGNYFLPSPSSNALFTGTTVFSPALSPVFDISTLFDSRTKSTKMRYSMSLLEISFQFFHFCVERLKSHLLV